MDFQFHYQLPINQIQIGNYDSIKKTSNTTQSVEHWTTLNIYCYLMFTIRFNSNLKFPILWIYRKFIYSLWCKTKQENIFAILVNWKNQYLGYLNSTLEIRDDFNTLNFWFDLIAMEIFVMNSYGNFCGNLLVFGSLAAGGNCPLDHSIWCCNEAPINHKTQTLM